MRRLCWLLLLLLPLTLVGCGGDRQNFKGKDKPVPPPENKG